MACLTTMSPVGTAFRDVYGRLFPVIGLESGAKVKVNFGNSEFKYKEEKGGENKKAGKNKKGKKLIRLEGPDPE